MPAKINGIIPPASFERIRDALGAVLLLELANQKALDPTFDAPDKVWLERIDPPNVPTELPYVNIRFQGGQYDEKSREITQVHGLYTYNIELSTRAKTTAVKAGDQIATVDIHRLIRAIRAILANQAYIRLGFAPPFNKQAYVNKVEVYQAQQWQDATNEVTAMIEYCIEVPEINIVTNKGGICSEVMTEVRINNTDIGYFLDVIEP